MAVSRKVDFCEYLLNSKLLQCNIYFKKISYWNFLEYFETFLGIASLLLGSGVGKGEGVTDWAKLEAFISTL